MPGAPQTVREWPCRWEKAHLLPVGMSLARRRGTCIVWVNDLENHLGVNCAVPRLEEGHKAIVEKLHKGHKWHCGGRQGPEEVGRRDCGVAKQHLWKLELAEMAKEIRTTIKATPCVAPESPLTRAHVSCLRGVEFRGLRRGRSPWLCG